MLQLTKTRVLIVLALAVMIGLAGCAGATNSESASVLPDYVQHADHAVQVSYQHAVDHPEDFETVPCYCGCHRIGHKSELNCFIKERAEDGTITFDNHASVCGVCIDIAQDVITMRAEGKSAVEVREAIDATYSKIGPGTDTAFPIEE